MSGTRQRRVVAAAVLLPVLLLTTALFARRAEEDRRTSDLTIGWDGDEEHPSCAYQPRDATVDCQVRVDGETATGGDEVSVEVTAYADENTSVPVGSALRTVPVEGTVHETFHVVVPVERAPHVDEDGVPACGLEIGQ